MGLVGLHRGIVRHLSTRGIMAAARLRGLSGLPAPGIVLVGAEREGQDPTSRGLFIERGRRGRSPLSSNGNGISEGIIDWAGFS